jgi:MFS family permease
MSKTPTAASANELGADIEIDPESHNPIAAPSTRRLLPSLGLNSLALFATINALWLVLLPAQVAGLDEAHKVTNLAIVNVVTLIFNIIVQPVVGTFSDRTRSPLGRRAPWMLGAAVLVLAATLVLGHLVTFGIVIIFWVLSQIGIQALSAPLTAIIPDRYPRAKRGIPSSMIGFGTLIGAGVGAVIAGHLVTNLPLGYTIFGVATFVTTVLLVLVNRDRSSSKLELPPFSARVFFAGFWVSPRKNPDFAWAFAARFIFYLGFFSSFALQLYILIDYVHLPLAAAGAQLGVNQVVALPFMVVAVLLGGWLSDKVGRRKVFIYIAAGFVVVAFAVLILMPTVPGALIWQILTGIAFGLYLSCDTALLTQVLPNNGRTAAKDLGILNIATSLPQSLASVVAAIILAAFGNPAGYVPLFIFGIICVVVASFVLIPVKSVR